MTAFMIIATSSSTERRGLTPSIIRSNYRCTERRTAACAASSRDDISSQLRRLRTSSQQKRAPWASSGSSESRRSNTDCACANRPSRQTQPVTVQAAQERTVVDHPPPQESIETLRQRQLGDPNPDLVVDARSLRGACELEVAEMGVRVDAPKIEDVQQAQCTAPIGEAPTIAGPGPHQHGQKWW